MKAQRTCLMRAKNLMALNFYFFLYDDIFGIKVAFRRDKLRRHQLATLRYADHPSTLRFATQIVHWASSMDYRFARRLLLCLQSVLHTHACEKRVMQSYAYNAPDTQPALYSANNYATTIRYSLYNAPWLPRRISDCGRQKRYPANPKPSRSTYAKRVFISGRGPTTKNKRGNALYYIGAQITIKHKRTFRWSIEILQKPVKTCDQKWSTLGMSDQ